MIKVLTSLNGENGDIKISINTTLLKQYYPNLKGITLNHKDCPKDLKVERVDSTTAMITFSSGLSSDDLGQPNEDGMIGIPTEHAMKIQKVSNIIKEFLDSAIKHCIKTTEFIPLYDFSGDKRNYSFEEMQEDVITAMKNKRNLCVIDKFQDYLDNNVVQKYCFNQHMIDYNKNADEYVDFILLVKAGKLKELREMYSGKLTKTEWF